MRLLSIIILLFCGLTIHAQDEFLVTLEGDTVNGNIFVVRENFYDMVMIKTEDEKLEYKAYQIASMSQDGSVFVPVDYRNRKAIGKQLFTGKINMYGFMTEDATDFREQAMIKENGDFLIVSNLGFRKNLQKFLSDCQEVVDQLETKQLAASDVIAVLNKYEEACVNTNKTQIPAIIKKQEAPATSLYDFAQLISTIRVFKDNNQPIPADLIEKLKAIKMDDLQQEIENLIKETGN